MSKRRDFGQYSGHGGVTGNIRLFTQMWPRFVPKTLKPLKVCSKSMIRSV